MLGKGLLLDNFTHFLEVETHVVVFEVVLNSLERATSDGIVVELEETFKIDPTIFVCIILVHNVVHSVVILEAGGFSGA